MAKREMKSTTLLPMKTKGSLDIKACSPKQSVPLLGINALVDINVFVSEEAGSLI